MHDQFTASDIKEAKLKISETRRMGICNSHEAHMLVDIKEPNQKIAMLIKPNSSSREVPLVGNHKIDMFAFLSQNKVLLRMAEDTLYNKDGNILKTLEACWILTDTFGQVKSIPKDL